MSNNISIPLIEVKLPVTGSTVVMAEYLTTGQSRELQKVLLSKGTFNSQENKFEGLSADSFFVMQDKAVEILIKSVKDKEGNPITFSKEWLDSLPLDDGNAIYNKANELTQSSQLTETAKKK